MHEHDQEIIMALAEGTLDDAAAATASAEIAGCSTCSADLELQRFALAALDDVPEAYLTATESARLHSALKTELSVPIPQPVQPKRSFAWGRWLPVAGAAAVFLFVLASLPTMFGGFGGSDDSGDETAAAIQTTEAAAERSEMSETTAAMELPAEALADDMAGEAGGSFTADADATTAAPETTAAESTEAPATDLNLYALLDYRGDLTNDLLTEVISELDDEVTNMLLNIDEVAALDPFIEACLREKVSPDVAPTLGIPIDSEPVLIGLTGDGTGEEYLLVAFVPEDVADTVVASISPVLCTVIEVLP